MYLILEAIGFVFLTILCTPITACALFLLLRIFYFQPRREDYFKVLDYEEWKTEDQVKLELEKLRGGITIRLFVCFGLVKLLKERLIEVYLIERVTEKGKPFQEYNYRKTDKRWPRRKVKDRTKSVKPALTWEPA